MTKTRVNWTIEKSQLLLLNKVQTEARKKGFKRSISQLIEEAITKTYTNPIDRIREEKKALARQMTRLSEEEAALLEQYGELKEE